MAASQETSSMALPEHQIAVLGLLAQRRKAGGESYVAGGVALNLTLGTARLSRDIDLFHDTDEALAKTWAEDRDALRAEGYTVTVIRESAAFVEALIGRKESLVLLQWARDSAFRFFPLVEDSVMGLTMHPLDLATNKVLALVGRLEPRDWVDVLECHLRLQPLGALLWAACGKDPGYTPDFLAEAAARQRYAQTEVDMLSFTGGAPDAAALGRRWKTAVAEARQLIALLPPDQAGHCLLQADGAPYSAEPSKWQEDLTEGRIHFHAGRIGGVWPTLK